MGEFRYRWEWDLRSDPETLWPFVADTNRFNRDADLSPVERVSSEGPRPRLRLSEMGMTVEWDEYPFEWVRPHYYRVLRRFHKGPIAEIEAAAELEPRAGGGTHLAYSMRVVPRTLLGRLVVPFKIGRQGRRNFEKAFRLYDEMATEGKSFLEPPPDAGARLQTHRKTLLAQGAPPDVVERLIRTIEGSDDLTVARIRPYALADFWKAPRRDVLETCLKATQIGLLDSRWDVLCPLCRGPKRSGRTLGEIENHVHCNACNVDFTADFDRSIELTFRPHPSVREIDVHEFCIGGPQITPHILAQQRIPAGEERSVAPTLERGRYRLRILGRPGARHLIVEPGGWDTVDLSARTEAWPAEELAISPKPTIHWVNDSDAERVFILERAAWSDFAATAADVTSLQLYRDLFAHESLRPGEQIAVGTMTILFTDLRESTRLYREIGDAPAFGRVMNHFDALKGIVAAEEGALVKTMGDATMAVFRRPARALRAALAAVRAVRPLVLKAGIHSGPCIAVTSNDRLDYFGSTVNLAARLEGLASGGDVVISSAVHSDPEVAAMAEHKMEPFQASLRGFDPERFDVWRITPS